MKEELSHTNEAFMDITVKKMEEQDRKINDLAKEINNSLCSTDGAEMVKQGIDDLLMEIKKIKFPAKEMQELFQQLKITSRALEQPTEREVLHHHHISKGIWAAIAIFLILCLAASGWYMTADKLGMYTANDTKYRYLKLDTASRSLQKYLDLVDSQYKSNPDLRQTVLEAEELNRKHVEMLQKANQMEHDATDLKRKVYTK